MQIFRSRLLVSTVVLALGCLAARRASADPTLLNGSFEDPAVTVTTAGGGTDWTSTGTIFVVPNSADLGQTPYGTQFLGERPGSTDSQTVAGFQADTTYVLGFDFVDSDAGGGTPTVTVTLSGVFGYTTSFTAPTASYSGTGTAPYTSEVLVFTAPTSGSETIKLADTGNVAIGIDNVGLYGNATAVPEPGSIAAALLGASAVAGAVRRRARGGS